MSLGGSEFLIGRAGISLDLLDLMVTNHSGLSKSPPTVEI